MKETWWSTQASVVQKAFDRKDSKAFYNGIKKVFGPQENSVSPVSSSDGTLLTDKGDILKRWKEHFDTVLNTTSVTDDDVIASIMQRPEISELSHEPTHQEVLDSIKQIPSGKAPGKEAIPPSRSTNTVPQEFKDASIQHLYKNKRKQKCVL